MKGPPGRCTSRKKAYAAGKEPLQWTVDHFKAIFTAPRDEPPLPEWDKQPTEGSPPFSLQELADAITKGKSRKAVGLDLTSYELLSHLMQDDVSSAALLKWLEDIRTGTPIPPEWLQTVITLLPKVPSPKGPSDLRPISLGSAIGKVFGQMLLGRTREVIQPAGPEQCAHSGRQTADYIFSAVRTFQLETEWRWGLHWMKLDIRKAFDSLSRSRALRHLRTVMPDRMYHEYNCWKRLLGPGLATVRTPWGEKQIQPDKRNPARRSGESIPLLGRHGECPTGGTKPSTVATRNWSGSRPPPARTALHGRYPAVERFPPRSRHEVQPLPRRPS